MVLIVCSISMLLKKLHKCVVWFSRWGREFCRSIHKWSRLNACNANFLTDAVERFLHLVTFQIWELWIFSVSNNEVKANVGWVWASGWFVWWFADLKVQLSFNRGRWLQTEKIEGHEDHWEGFCFVSCGRGSGVEPASCYWTVTGLIPLVCISKCPWAGYWNPTCSCWWHLAW